MRFRRRGRAGRRFVRRGNFRMRRRRFGRKRFRRGSGAGGTRGYRIGIRM